MTTLTREEFDEKVNEWFASPKKLDKSIKVRFNEKMDFEIESCNCENDVEELAGLFLGFNLKLEEVCKLTGRSKKELMFALKKVAGIK